MSSKFNYNDFVLVAHDQWELNCPTREVTTKFSAHLGGFRWLVTFVEQDHVTVECVEFKEQIVSDEFHLELFIYKRQKEGDDYKLADKPSRTLFKHNKTECRIIDDGDSDDDYSLPPSGSNEFVAVAVNVRILKDRALFHDFSVDQPIGHLQNDLKLKVGEQIFHVNKQMLEQVSPYFHRMLNNPNFVKAKQDAVDTGETDVALFHDFLLIITPMASGKFSVLPNTKNLAGLLRLAQYYGVDSLFEKFERSLNLCREMPTAERILLAKKYGGKQINVAGILQEVTSLADSKRIIMAIFDAVE